jgi:predicted HTH domain antitoxin
MRGVPITLSDELLEAAGFNPATASREVAQLLALELYRENKISVGRASELCRMPLDAFMDFAGNLSRRCSRHLLHLRPRTVRT